MKFCPLDTSCVHSVTRNIAHITALSILEEYRRCSLFLCVVAINSLTTKPPYAFFTILLPSNRIFDSYEISLRIKMLQVSSSGVKPSFVKCVLRFSSALESSTYVTGRRRRNRSRTHTKQTYKAIWRTRRTSCVHCLLFP